MHQVLLVYEQRFLFRYNLVRLDCVRSIIDLQIIVWYLSYRTALVTRWFHVVNRLKFFLSSWGWFCEAFPVWRIVSLEQIINLLNLAEQFAYALIIVLLNYNDQLIEVLCDLLFFNDPKLITDCLKLVVEVAWLWVFNLFKKVYEFKVDLIFLWYWRFVQAYILIWNLLRELVAVCISTLIVKIPPL